MSVYLWCKMTGKLTGYHGPVAVLKCVAKVPILS